MKEVVLMTLEKNEIIDETEIEELAIDGICGVY